METVRNHGSSSLQSIISSFVRKLIADVARIYERNERLLDSIERSPFEKEEKNKTVLRPFKVQRKRRSFL